MLSAAIWLGTLIFSAGIFWATVRLTQKENAKEFQSVRNDLKGVSGKVNGVAKKEDTRYLALCLVIIQFVPEKDRMTAAAMLKQGSD